MADPDNMFENEFFVPHIDYEKVTGIQKIRAGIKSIYNAEARKKFGAFLDFYKPEIIHAHNIYHQLSFSILDEAFKRSIPVVMTLHDYKMMSPNYRLFHHGKTDMSMLGGAYYRCLLNNCGESFSRSLMLTSEAYLRKWKKYQEKISFFIAPSNWMKEIAVRSKIPESKVKIIPNPIRLSKVELADVPDKGYVLYFGRFSEEKGLMTLLETAKETPEISYHLVGDGSLRPHLEKYIENHKLSNVKLFSFQSGNTLVDTIKGARFTVLPAIWPENSPTSIIRSIGNSRMVIGTNVGGIPEILPKSMLVSPNNSEALAQMIREWYNASLLKRTEAVKQLQKNIVKKHAPEHYYSLLLQCYEQAVSHA
jgi:glycosyltransferase involved in cell wall biosynthesis